MTARCDSHQNTDYSGTLNKVTFNQPILALFASKFLNGHIKQYIILIVFQTI